MFGINFLDVALVRYNDPYTSAGVVKNAILLQIGTSPGESIFNLGLIAFLWIVEDVKDLFGQIEFFNGTFFPTPGG